MRDQNRPMKEIPESLLNLRAEMVRCRIRPIDVAIRAGVNPSVVSHVLTGTGSSERVLEVIREMIREKACAKECIPSMGSLQV